MTAIIIALVGYGITGIVYGVRLEGKIEKTNTEHDALKELIGSQLADIKERLVRIERHVLNGSYHEHN